MGTLTIVEYTYNGDGDLVRRTAGGQTVTYTLDPAGLTDVLEARQGSNVTTYLYTLDLAGEQTPGGQRYYYGRDALGSVRFVMDGDAELVGRYEYGPFGDLYGHAGTEHAFRFAGEQWDEASSLYYLRARHYDPALGRFMTRDPFPGLLTMPQSLHPYVYAGNNPVNLTDPSGRFAVVVVPMIAGGLAGGGFAAWAYLQAHPCADFFHDPAFQQAVGAGMLAGVAGGAASYLAGYMLVAILPSSTLEGAILLGIVSGAAESGSSQVVMNAVTGRALDEGLGIAIVSGGVTGGVGGAVGYRVGRVFTTSGHRVGQSVEGSKPWSPTYRDIRVSGSKDAHHIVLDAAVRDIRGYSYYDAPAVHLSGPAVRPGTSHYAATQAQKLGPHGTYGAELETARNALEAAGKSKVEIDAAIRRANMYFADYLGLTPNTHTRIPTFLRRWK